MDINIPIVGDYDRDLKYKPPKTIGAGVFDSKPKGMIKERSDD
jgi:hypothetical protein